ncbi:MAG: hypothetical protein LIO69_03700 [Oscillospiraceae bacterium]|nr:hypothetical protein [Oscillospiraceae bacterium]
MTLRINSVESGIDHMEFSSYTFHEPLYVNDPTVARKTEAHVKSMAAGFAEECGKPVLNGSDSNVSFISESEIR